MFEVLAAFRVNVIELRASKLCYKVFGVTSLRRNIQGDSEGYVKILGGDNIGLCEENNIKF